MEDGSYSVELHVPSLRCTSFNNLLIYNPEATIFENGLESYARTTEFYFVEEKMVKQLPSPNSRPMYLKP